MPLLRALTLLFTVLCCNVTAWGATVWQPTDGNTNYAYLAGPAPGTVTFALFDVDGTTLSVNPGSYLQFAPGDQISFTLVGGVFLAINDSLPAAPSLSLGNSNHFAIGASQGAGWVLDDGTPTLLGTNLYALKFVFSGGSSILLQVDAKAVGTVSSVIPVPGSALLLGSGFLTLLGRGRRGRSGV